MKLLNFAGSGVTTYALHPGVVRTEIGRHLGDIPVWGRVANFLVNNVVYWFQKTAVEGAQTSIYCAVDSALEKETGKYYR